MNPDQRPHADRLVPVKPSRQPSYVRTGDYVVSKHMPKSRPRLVTDVFWEPGGDTLYLEGHSPLMAPVPANRFIVVEPKEI